jgi:hypothetical protein
LSDGPSIPRLLAAILGVDQPGAARPGMVAPQGPPRRSATQTPAPAAAPPPAPRLTPPTPRLTPPDRLQQRSERVPARPVRVRPAAATAATPASTNPVRRPRPDHGDTGAAYVLPAAGDAAMTRAALRTVLRSPAHARTAVLAAEVLGAPRALRPFGSD